MRTSAINESTGGKFSNTPMSGKTSVNSKDGSGLTKSKPTGMNVLSMTINNKKTFPKWKSIILRFHYVKKQFQIEFETDKEALGFEEQSKEKTRIEINFTDVIYFNVLSNEGQIVIECHGKG